MDFAYLELVPMSHVFICPLLYVFLVNVCCSSYQPDMANEQKRNNNIYHRRTEQKKQSGYNNYVHLQWGSTDHREWTPAQQQ